MLKNAARRLIRFAVWTVVVLYWLWAIGAAWHLNIAPQLLRYGMAVAFVAAPIVVLLRTKRRVRFLQTILSVIAIMAVCWWFMKPSNDRNWQAEVAFPISVEFSGDSIRIENYLTREGLATRELDLGQLDRVWFGVEKFPGFDGAAHSFLTFEFADGEFLSASVEARKERDEAYGLFPALFRQFELIYLIGEEAEVFAARTNFESPTYLFPLKSNLEQRRKLLVDICQRANRLRAKPEWYNILNNNCTNNLAWHASHLALRPISSYDLRVVLSGRADSLLYELGMIDMDGDLADVEAVCRIDRLARKLGDDDGFSFNIRQSFHNAEQTGAEIKTD